MTSVAISVHFQGSGNNSHVQTVGLTSCEIGLLTQMGPVSAQDPAQKNTNLN